MSSLNFLVLILRRHAIFREYQEIVHGRLHNAKGYLLIVEVESSN